jgi:hypothetical protein
MARDDRYISSGGYSGTDRRHSNGNGNGRDWTSLRAWAQAIGVVGIPGAIAVGLVYVGATEIPRLSRQQEQILTEIRLSREATATQNELLNTLIRIAQRTCSNAAKDDNARQKCFDK